jgi:hypothetical protein
MDGRHFDRLTVHLTGMLTRRRFGRLLLGLGLGGAASLAEAAVDPQPARAFRCSNGATKCCREDGPVCDGECCGENCYFTSQAYCADGGFICPLNWSFCRDGHVGTCCPPRSTCCGGRLCCYLDNNEFCPRPEIAHCCRIGQTVCDRPDDSFFCCSERSECCGDVCCNTDQEFCAFANADKCCRHGQIPCLRAADGIASCWPDPPCSPGEALDLSLCKCRPCENGLIACQGRCVLKCAQNQVLDPTTCACKCLGEACGATCCPAGYECATDRTDPPKCCPAGTACGGFCEGDPEIQCCASSAGRLPCPKKNTCCPKGKNGGGDCCRTEDEVCNQGRCVPKPKKKRKKHKKH